MAFTYFFRDLQTLELAVRHVVPYTTGRSHIRVWDAGCAAGQEAYTLAMLFAENMGGFAFKNLHIHATDIDECDLFAQTVRSGVYKEEELRRMPPQMLGRYFQREDRPGFFKVAEDVRKRVLYAKHDLLTFESIGEGFSMIACKNVLLHFQPAERIEVIRMFHRSLAPGGYFVTEQTQKMPPQTARLFEQVSLEAQVFRKAGGG